MPRDTFINNNYGPGNHVNNNQKPSANGFTFNNNNAYGSSITNNNGYDPSQSNFQFDLNRLSQQLFQDRQNEKNVNKPVLMDAMNDEELRKDTKMQPIYYNTDKAKVVIGYNILINNKIVNTVMDPTFIKFFNKNSQSENRNVFVNNNNFL